MSWEIEWEKVIVLPSWEITHTNEDNDESTFDDDYEPDHVKQDN